MRLAIIEATGMVGNVIREILLERMFPVTDLVLVASSKSQGNKINWNHKDYELVSIEKALNKKPDLAIFSAGSEVSKNFAQKFADQGCFVIDNSSFWRMNPNTPLIVPEINSDELTEKKLIIANPNCSTIQLVMALAPLHNKYKMKRVIVSTYQSVSGTGVKAVKQLENEIKGLKTEMAYPYPIHKNALPHCDDFEENGYTKEEMKLAREPQKILNDQSFLISATAVRIPTAGGHSESVNIEFRKSFRISEIRKILHETPGVTVQDNPDTNTYPMPIYAHDKDEVFVGRIRKDLSQDNTLNMWIVSDNLRKGAATNAIQIAEYVLNNFLKS